MNSTIRKHSYSLAIRSIVALLASQLFLGSVWADDSAEIAKLKGQLEAVQRDVAQIAESKVPGSAESSTPLRGFADVGYTRASNDQTRLDQAGNGFWANSLDFYLTPQFTDRSKALIELIFEFAPDGGLATDLERIQLGYSFNDQLTTWVGRFHAPYGYWNTGFHHGAEIQTSILRPRFIDFEDKGGLLPSHVMGAWATGHVGMGEDKLTYDFYTGNGNSLDLNTDLATGGALTHSGSLGINNSRDSNGNKLVGANIGYNMGSLVVGAHAFAKRVTMNDANDTVSGEVGVKMTGLYGFYDDGNWEAITEYYRFNNDNLTAAPGTGSHSSWLGFAQLGHTVGDWTPYVRGERTSLDQNDLYFLHQEYGISYSRLALGVRYMLNPKAALKLEINQTKEGDGIPTATVADNGKYNEVRVQYSIRF